MLEAAYSCDQGLPGEALYNSQQLDRPGLAVVERWLLLGGIVSGSTSEHMPQAACYNELQHQCIKNDSSDQSPNPNNKSAYMFLATQMMCEIGTTLGKKVAAGKLTEKEMYGTAAEYLGKCPSNSAKIDPMHLLAHPNQMAALLEPEAREHFENILRVRGTDSITDKCDIDKSDRAGDHVRAGTSMAFKEESLTDMSLDRSKGDVVSEVKKELPDPATVEKGEPISKVEVGPVAFSHVSASMIYDEGTDVDTGITERTDIPPDYVFELNEALSPRQKKKQPEKKSSWWKMGAAVVGVGLVGLAGVGAYKYFNS